MPAAPPSCTARRPRAPRRIVRASTRPTVHVAAVRPKVIGTACCSSVRPGARSSRCRCASVAAASIARLSPAVGRPQGPCPQQHERGVDDVLAGRSPVDGRGGLGRYQDAQVGDERDHRVAGPRRPPGQVGHVEARGVARARYRFRLRGGDYSGVGQRAGQGGFDVEHGLQPRPVVERGPHGVGRVGRAEQRRGLRRQRTRSPARLGGGCRSAASPPRCRPWPPASHGRPGRRRGPGSDRWHWPGSRRGSRGG